MDLRVCLSKVLEDRNKEKNRIIKLTADTNKVFVFLNQVLRM